MLEASYLVDITLCMNRIQHILRRTDKMRNLYILQRLFYRGTLLNEVMTKRPKKETHFI